MAHEHLRKEKDCLNCGSIVAGPYCQECGQKNVVPKQSLWHLITHFFNDFTHFDGRFFLTLKLLLLKPGFVSKEWVKGRRTKYLDPVRMYLFVSAVAVLVIFSTISPPPHNYVSSTSQEALILDSVRKNSTDGFAFYIEDLPDSAGEIFVLNFSDEFKHGVAHYDSFQSSLPVDKRAGRLEAYLGRKASLAYQVYDHDPFNFLPNMVRKWIAATSKVFFISLPLFSILLVLLYIRRRKNFYFVTHAIFSIHFYIVCLLWLAFTVPIMEALPEDGKGTSIASITEMTLNILIPVFMFVYLFLAMKRFYEQGWVKTFIKATLLYITNGTILILLIVIFLLNSFISMGV